MRDKESQMVEFYKRKVEEAMHAQFRRAGSGKIVNYWMDKLRTAREMERNGLKGQPC